MDTSLLISVCYPNYDTGLEQLQLVPKLHMQSGVAVLGRTQYHCGHYMYGVRSVSFVYRVLSIKRTTTDNQL